MLSGHHSVPGGLVGDKACGTSSCAPRGSPAFPRGLSWRNSQGHPASPPRRCGSYLTVWKTLNHRKAPRLPRRPRRSAQFSCFRWPQCFHRGRQAGGADFPRSGQTFLAKRSVFSMDLFATQTAVTHSRPLLRMLCLSGWDTLSAEPVWVSSPTPPPGRSREAEGCTWFLSARGEAPLMDGRLGHWDPAAPTEPVCKPRSRTEGASLIMRSSPAPASQSLLLLLLLRGGLRKVPTES